VRKPSPPAADRPEWNRNPVDQFIYAKLKEKGLAPGKKADKATLLRRVTFDLTGLPATRGRDRRVCEDSSADAFEKTHRPHDGHPAIWRTMGAPLARPGPLCDTAGDAADFPVPEMYKYRNYVIQSFVKDKPYDQFRGRRSRAIYCPRPTKRSTGSRLWRPVTSPYRGASE